MAEFSVAVWRAAVERATEAIKARIAARAERAANTHAANLRSQYPVRKTRPRSGPAPGGLVRGVSVRPLPGFGYIVRSAAPHVHFYEQGTVERYDATRKNARRGKMPATRVAIPSAVSERRSYLQDAQRLLDQHHEVG